MACIENNIENCENVAFPQVSHYVASQIEIYATALISDGYKLSNRTTTAVASCVLQDFGMINEGNSSLVIDKSKGKREKSKMCDYLRTKTNTYLLGLCFDGLKDNTCYQEKKWTQNREDWRKKNIDPSV